MCPNFNRKDLKLRLLTVCDTMRMFIYIWLGSPHSISNDI